MGRSWALLVLLACAWAIPGCSKDSGPQPIGLTREESQELAAARSRFDGADDAPFTAQTHFAAGELAESQGALERALDQYRAAVKLDPHHLPSLYRIGVVYSRQKAWPQAIQAWEQYVKASGDDPAALGNLAFCHELAGQAEKAEATYRRGIAIDPRSQPCRINYGLMLARNGRTTEALLQFQAVLPEAQAHYNVGSVMEQLGKREQARAEYRKALELDPALADAQSRLAALE